MPPDADAAKFTSARQPIRGFRRGGAAQLPKSGHRTRPSSPKPKREWRDNVFVERLWRTEREIAKIALRRVTCFTDQVKRTG
jgi:hypothetical protein